MLFFFMSMFCYYFIIIDFSYSTKKENCSSFLSYF
nr:MAG TPA: hypothetical protein [Bacteriophage sp.]